MTPSNSNQSNEMMPDGCAEKWIMIEVSSRNVSRTEWAVTLMQELVLPEYGHKV